MKDQLPNILILEDKIDHKELQRLLQSYFGDMVKYVVDVRRKIVAVGGELHADAERILLEAGSRQEDLWGANYYPGQGPDNCIDYVALINIRPSQDNRSMEIADGQIRSVVRDVTFALIGEGEEV
jgi:hypothetical protein